MRTAAVLEQVIPLRPRLQRLPVLVDDDDAVAEFGSGRRGLLVEGAPGAGEIVRELGRQLQLAAVGDEDAVRRLGEDPARRSPDVSGLGESKRLRPPLHDIVGSGAIVTAFFLEQRGRRHVAEADDGNGREEKRAHGWPPFHGYFFFGALNDRSIASSTSVETG